MQKIKLNIVPKGVKKTAYLSQNDNGRVVRYELFNELVPYTLDGSETITVKVVRPDGEEIVSSVPNTEEAYIDVTFNDDMSAIAGVGAGEIKITDGETVLGSHNFDINVEIDAYNGKDVVIETETGTLLSFNTEVEDNALEYESEIPYNAEGYTGLEIINSRTAPAYDKTPYLFRKTPSGYGNSCIEKLNGLTVAYNQLCKSDVYSSSYNGITYTNNGDGSYTASGEVDNSDGSWFALTGGYASVIGHVYFYEIFGNTETEFWEFGYAQQTRTKTAKIYKITGSNRFGLYIAYGTGNINETVKCICIDLTQMLGSTIADYLYNLEAQTAGAGVSLFKSLGFDKPYFEYNAGSLLSSKPVSKKVVGFNQWSEEWEVGSISTLTGEITAGDRVVSKNHISVFANTSYYIMVGVAWVFFYDGNKNLISYTQPDTNRLVTTPSNCAFLMFYTNNAYGSTYNNDICINISDPDKNGTYEPYSEETYNLGGDELRGLLKLDANNNIYADGDIYTSDGKNKRRYGIVDLGSLTWGKQNDYPEFRAVLSNLPPNPQGNVVSPCICAKYVSITPNQAYHGQYKGIALVGSYVSVGDDSYPDAAAFKASLSGVYLVYEKATPTEEESLAYDNPQEVKITEEFIDERSIPIPVGHDTIYGTDIEYQDIDFDTTIFGGNINAVDGALSSEYNSDGSVKPTPEIIDITPTPIPVRAGDNNIFNSANGNQTIRYYNQVEE